MARALVPFAAKSEAGRAHWLVRGRTPGSLLEYASEGSDRATPGIEWRPNEPFRALLRPISTERGRSAARVIWGDEQGRTFPMFLTDLVETLCTGLAKPEGWIDAEWMVAKRGANYGIRLASLVPDNGSRAANRPQPSADPVEHDYRWVGLWGGSVKHLLSPEGAKYQTYAICFAVDRPFDGWATGPRVDKRKPCRKCTDRFNWAMESAEIERRRLAAESKREDD